MLWKNTNPTERELDEFIAKWKTRVIEAIRTVENRARAGKSQPALNPKYQIRLAGHMNGPGQDICLLNFHAWALRYGVTVEFQIEALRNAWPRRYRLLQRSDFYILALKPRHLTTVAARRRIERAVREAYPGGEQWSILARPPLPNPDVPIARIREQRDAQDERRRHPRRNYRRPELDWRKALNENVE